MGIFVAPGGRAFADCLNPINAIEAENCLPGNPASEWDVSGAGDANLQGFATDISVNRGGTVSFKIDTTASAYRIDVYRLGYYQGNGARKIATVPNAATTKTNQPSCVSQISTTGLVDCGNWSVSATWAVPATAVSGIYVARLVGESGGIGASHVVFVVRHDGGTSDVLFQTSDTTWLAYNRYGGTSLYQGSGPGGGLSGAGRAYKVSYNRPFTTREYAPEDWVFNAEYPMIRWLERNGYDVSYTTGVDADRRGAELARHKVFLSVGHDEYWSKQQRLNVERARDGLYPGQTAPLHLAFFSGNEVFWKTRWEASIDGSGTPHRTLVCYKETHAGAKIDPSSEWTGTWRDPRFSPPSDGGQPENALTGTIFTVNGVRSDSFRVPAADGKMRFWRNTPNVSTLGAGQTWGSPTGTLGYEWDEDLDNGFRPAGLVRLSTTTLNVSTGVVQDYGSTYAPGTATHRLVFHKRPNGAVVFGSGTVQWPWGLDAEHDRGSAAPSVDMQQATVNLFADMGAQPATLQSGLLPASPSSDVVAPVSDITSPANGATVQPGNPVTIQGTATDGIPGLVGGVEVSVDGGLSWHPADGRESWSYVFTPAVAGSYTILSRAVDDSGNLEAPGAGRTLVVSGGSDGSTSIWAGTGTPATQNVYDGQELEIGVKFRSSSAGNITRIRFYKASNDGGSHVVSLWSGSGTLLATATSSGETASGWQEVALPSPVAITANTTYVASYHAQPGYYVASASYFTQAVVNGPLTALASGTDGGNGVYRYGPSGFPTSSWNATNYWVDVVFATQGSGPDATPPTVASTTPSGGATGALVSTNVTARFSEALAPGTVGGTTVQLRDAASQLVSATVTWDGAMNAAILDPASNLAYSTTYTATVKGGSAGVTDVAGNPLASDFSWSFTTEAPPPSGLVSLWGGAGTPAVTNASDGQAIEVGVKVRSSIAGYITALRFYKGSQDNGTHVGHLWSSTGTLLATATFVGETASGWQEVALGSPVAIAANTTYVASCHSSAGYYSATGAYFTQPLTNGPLTALADGTDGGNGLYRYGVSGFPTASFNATNYWVDVVFSAQPPGPDTTAPSVVATTPSSGAFGVVAGTNVTARFSEPLAPGTVNGTNFQLRDGLGQLVGAVVAWDAASASAVLDPTGGLAYSTAYTATVRGGAGGVTDVAGNPLASDFSWSFTTEAPPPPPPTEGPGGPVLVIGATGNPFSRYYAEILRAEGLNAFTVADISTVNSSVLSSYDVAILGEMPLSSSQVAMLTDWVNAGGNLIAMRPDKQLAGLLGLADAASSLSNGYLQVDTGAAPGFGIVGQTVQFHGAADRYTLAGASPVATLFSGPATATANPAITLRSVGGNGGEAAAFAFDLARSIVYTRQGNPEWAGQKRDGQAGPIRSDDLFYPDWVNLDKVAIPQADEQQRLLANLILHVNRDRKPLPRFWYFPRGEKAVVVMTSDNHGSQNVETRFQAEDAASAPGCSVDDWECIRSSVYLYTSALPGDAVAKLWQDKGFEVALHVNTNCANWTPTSLAGFYSSQIAGFFSTFPSLAPLKTNRTHCIAWSDWATQPKVALQNGIRLDTNYYYWPPEWVANRPGFFTGSGIPMRFADVDGSMIDVYQATTQMTDESGQGYPFTINTLLDRALGAEGYYGAFTTNIHTDGSTESQAAAIVASAKARSVPVVSAKQMLTWLDGRNGSSFEDIAWSAGTLTFGISVAAGANGLQAMVPTAAAGSPLASLRRGGVTVPFTRQTVKGVEYAVFAADPGTYQAAYTPDTTAPVISSLSVAVGTGGTATVQWATDEPATSVVRYGTAPGSLTQAVSDPLLLTAHGIQLTGLAAGTTYYYQVTSVDAAGNSASSAVGSFATTADTTPPTVSLVAPVGGEVLYTGSPYLIRWTATDNVGVTSIDVAFSSDGGTTYAAVAGCTGLAGTAQSCAWAAPGPATTQGRIRVTARDAAGQTGTATSGANFTVATDTTAPTVAVTAPVAGATVSGTVTVSATASDDVAVAGVQFLLDGALLGVEDTTSPYSVAWNTAAATAGSHSLTARARDAAGNQTTSAAVSVTVASVPMGLVAAYGFEEGSGTTTTDASGLGNTGTIAAGTWSTTGRFGKALSFDGTSSLVTINDAAALRLTSAMTLEAWVRPTALASWRCAVLKEAAGGLAYGLYASDASSRPGGFVRVGSDVEAMAPSAITLDAWTHLAATYDGATLRLFVNGTEVTSRALTGAIVSSTQPLRIGGNQVWGEYFAGLIDEVRVYNRALSAAEIQADMNVPVGSSADTTAPVISSVSTSVGGSSTATVQWATDEPATSVVRYGTAPGSLTQSVSDPLLLTAHGIQLTGLTASTTYYYQVTSVDAAGNSASSAVGSFVTTAGGTPPTVSLVAPVGGERLYTGSPYVIRWTASDDVGVASIDVAFSSDGGTSYAAVAGCTGLAGTAQSCTWAAPGPATVAGRIRVTARDAAGQTGSAASGANFTVVSGTPSVTLTAPDTAVTWAIGSTQSVTFNHNLGVGATVVIDLSRDGGATWGTVNPAFVTTSATTGTYSWIVPSPATTTARIRVGWAGNPAVNDVSAVSFTINGTISVTAPTTGARWAIGTPRSITWNHTLGAGQLFDILLSTDGGTTFPTTIASSVAGGSTSGSHTWVVPGPVTTTARVRVTWAARAATRGTTGNFRMENPVVTVTAPNTNVAWGVGSTRNLTFSHNLGVGQAVNIEVSRDGGATFSPITTFTTTSATSGSFSWVVTGPATTQARIRVTWTTNPGVTDVSNVNFQIQ